jgi:ketosteroid isomerase-like protein
MTSNSSSSQTIDAILSETIIGLERSALEEWNKGNPDGYLDISAQDVVYFDPFTEHRLDGHEALRSYYEPIRGQVQGTYEMINPKVQATKEIAVLTFNLMAYSGDNLTRWNCTEVYRLEKDAKWKIIQTHWSYIQPKLK